MKCNDMGSICKEGQPFRWKVVIRQFLHTSIMLQNACLWELVTVVIN